MNTPLAGEDLNLDDYRGMDPVQMMFALRRALEFKMPPVGVTRHTATIGGTLFERFTWRCDKPNCWYTCTPRNAGHVDEMKKRHESDCPYAPRRESLPSGLAEIEKLWREVDDVMDALKSGASYRDMEGKELQAFVKGLAFSIVMKDKELWPTIKDVAAQALKRWKMRQGEIPFEQTPTRHSNDFSGIGQRGGWQAVAGQTPSTPARKAAVTRAAKAAPAAPALPANKVRDIKSAKASGMFSDDDIALMYGVTISQVKSVQ